jgi:CheY-like chemotaxis protein
MNRVHCVLLVDDDDTSNFLTRTVMEDLDFADHIHVSENGSEALKFIRERCSPEVEEATHLCPELILLDINMPVMDGFGFLEEFQKWQSVRKKPISVVMLTSSSNARDQERAQKYGIAGYLDKPLTEAKIRRIAHSNS